MSKQRPSQHSHMDWLDAFDPASASNRATQQRLALSRARQSSTHGSSTPHAPSPLGQPPTAPVITQAGPFPRPPLPSHASRPPQGFSTTTRAPPLSAMLRPEDAQLNDYQVCSRLWERAEPTFHRPLEVADQPARRWQPHSTTPSHEPPGAWAVCMVGGGRILLHILWVPVAVVQLRHSPPDVFRDAEPRASGVTAVWPAALQRWW